MVRTTKNHKKIWTKEQDDFLLEYYGSATVKWVADRLGKTEHAIRQRLQVIDGSCDTYISSGMLSPRQIAPALGVSHNTIVNWIRYHDFPAKRLHEVKDTEKRYRYFVDSGLAWKWIKKNKQRINFAHYKYGILLPEPKWLSEEITKAKQNIIKRPTNWTKGEDDIAWFWYQGGMGYREIAARLKRPETGTQRRLTTIKKNKQKTNDN